MKINKELDEKLKDFINKKIEEIMAEYQYSKDNPDLKRYKMIAIVNGEPLVFKRYGTEMEKTKRELIVFIHEKYGVFTDKVEIEEDKTHPVKV